jgi:hypothetical protein
MKQKGVDPYSRRLGHPFEELSSWPFAPFVTKIMVLVSSFNVESGGITDSKA